MATKVSPWVQDEGQAPKDPLETFVLLYFHCCRSILTSILSWTEWQTKSRELFFKSPPNYEAHCMRYNMLTYNGMLPNKIPVGLRRVGPRPQMWFLWSWAMFLWRPAGSMLSLFLTSASWLWIQPIPQLVPLSSIYSFPDSLLPAIFPWVTRLIFWNLMLSSLRVTAAKGCLSWSHQGHFLLVASFLPTASISSIHVRFHCGDLFTCPWDVFWGTLNSKTLLLLLTVFRMEGNWQSNRTRKIESYYCSLGSLALLPVFDSAHFQHLSLRVLIDRWPPNAYASQ